MISALTAPERFRHREVPDLLLELLVVLSGMDA
eukprot:SAG31_NODE_36192_length_315_cov_1.416667_1_plen_32_part_10